MNPKAIESAVLATRGEGWTDRRELVTAALEAALPHLEAALRAQIAAEHDPNRKTP